MTGETPEVRFDKRKQKEEREDREERERKRNRRRTIFDTGKNSVLPKI